jgi:hypothetical protein
MDYFRKSLSTITCFHKIAFYVGINMLTSYVYYQHYERKGQIYSGIRKYLHI